MTTAAGSKMFENHLPSFISVYSLDSSPAEDARIAHAQSLHKRFHTDNSINNRRNENMKPVINSEIILDNPSPNSSPTTLTQPSLFVDSSFMIDHSAIKLRVNTSRSSSSDQRPMSSPTPRKKNLKSLALDLSPNTECFQISEPSSPSFIRPPALKGRKKPSLLSLNTGAANNILNDCMSSPGMSSMLQRRGLKHSVSTPQILATPSFGPSGGMTLRPSILASSRLRDSSPALDTLNSFHAVMDDTQEPQTGVQMATRVPGATVGGDTFDRPHSGEDAKSPSYPVGPILMHEPSVFLYLEPKRDEAMLFDVVINVAREVKCPFNKDEVIPRNLPRTSHADLNRRPLMPDSAPRKNMAFQPLEPGLPTPQMTDSSTHSDQVRPKPSGESQFPEYFHVPWDHSTDVQDELWDLCALIHARSKEGKKVLVHCQQGASRSATLIIAYGMYINPDLGPNDAYQLAQSKSRWVNPNMSLLFSLNDFKKMIDDKRSEKPRKPPVKHRTALSTDMRDSSSSASRRNSIPTIPIRGDLGADVKDERIPLPGSANEIDSTISKLGAFDFGLSSLKPMHEKHEWKSTPPCVETIHKRSPRTLGSGQGSNTNSILLSSRVSEIPRQPCFTSNIRTFRSVSMDPRGTSNNSQASFNRSVDRLL